MAKIRGDPIREDTCKKAELFNGTVPRKPKKHTWCEAAERNALTMCVTTSLLSPTSIHTATQSKTKKRPAACARHTSTVRRQFAAKRVTLFRASLLQPLTTFHRSPAGTADDTLSWQHLHTARQRFRPRIVPGTTRKHANETATALQSLRRASARSYLRHSPPLRPFNHRADQARHRATKRGSRSGSCVS
jgi:hypothetical protein